MIADLNRYLDGWIRWFRWRRAVAWAGRGLLCGLALSLAIALVAVYRGQLLRAEFLALTAFISVAGLLLAALAAYLWPISRLPVARAFDLHFGLRERVSTALEIAHRSPDPAGVAGEPPRLPPPALALTQLAQAQLAEAQLADALASASQVNPSQQLPLRLPWRSLLAAGILVSITALVWARGGDYFRAAESNRAIQEAIAAEIAALEALSAEIEADTAISPEERQALARPVEEALHELAEARSLEQAVSVLVAAEQELSALADDQARGQAQGLRAAGESLSGQPGGPLQQVGEDLAAGDPLAAAQSLQDLDPASLSPAEKEALARQLEQAAAELASTNPELAQQLRAAAGALRQGDSQSARQALQQASQTLSQAGQQVARAQLAEQAAAQAAQGQRRLVQAGQSQQAASGDDPTGEPAPGQASEQGQSPGQGQGAGQGQGSGAQAGQGSAGGAGRGEGDRAGDPGGEAGRDPIAQDNAPGDGGERGYEQIHAPQRLGGESDLNVTLPGSGEPGDEILGQVGALPGENGAARVPYVQVFPTYQEAYRRAIDSGQIPPALRPLVREYFSSLEP